MEAMALPIAFPALIVVLYRLYVMHDPRVKAHADLAFPLTYWSINSLLATIAYWKLRKGHPSARGWALAASVTNLGQFGFQTLVGIIGLLAFSRKDISAQISKHVAFEAPVEGDGTNPWFDKLMPFLSFGWLIFASALWGKWAMSHGLPRSQGFTRLLEFGLAVHVGVFLHELGHLLAGWGSGMMLRGFDLGPVQARIHSGRWRFCLNPAGILGNGAVAMVPIGMKNVRGRMLLMIFGGPVGSLFFGSISILIALSAHGHAWQPAWRFFALMGSMCLCDFVINLIPLRPEGHYSDGAQIFQLMRQGGWADVHLAISMAGASLVTSLRPRDFDAATLRRAADFLLTGPRGLSMRLFIAVHHLDSGRFKEASRAWREAAEMGAAKALPADSMAEFVFFEAAIADDLEKARVWWARMEAKGDSRKEVDYWKGRTALLLREGKLDEAHKACEHGERLADALPVAGAYDFDRWCFQLLREKLSAAHSSQVSALRKRASESVVTVPVLQYQ